MNLKKEKAFALRKKGYSYNMISDQLGINKSTLSCWFKDLPFVPNELVVERIKRGPFKSGQIRHNQRVNDIIKIKKEAKQELGKISRRDLWMVGVGLYIGEGTKAYETVQIINSNPEIIKLSIGWLIDICGVKKENITLAMHLYPDNNEEKCRKYWSKITNLPSKQFRKTQVDRRMNKTNNKKKKLPYGTTLVSVVSDGNPDFGVKLHRRIMGWIESILAQAR